MKSVHSEGNSLWVGWSGLEEENLDEDQQQQVHEALKKEKCVPVSLTSNDVEDFYLGFSNKTIWPLFHYFVEYATFEEKQWASYKEVNQKFTDNRGLGEDHFHSFHGIYGREIC